MKTPRLFQKGTNVSNKEWTDKIILPYQILLEPFRAPKIVQGSLLSLVLSRFYLIKAEATF